MFEKEKRTTFQTAASSCCDLCCPKWALFLEGALEDSPCPFPVIVWIGRPGLDFGWEWEVRIGFYLSTGYIGCSLGALIEAGGSAWAIGFWGGAQLDWPRIPFGDQCSFFFSVFKFCFSHWWIKILSFFKVTVGRDREHTREWGCGKIARFSALSWLMSDNPTRWRRQGQGLNLGSVCCCWDRGALSNLNKVRAVSKDSSWFDILNGDRDSSQF